jgi:magnesium chelatase family protein
MTHDTSDIHGNRPAARALEIAAAGHHGLLLVGHRAAPKTQIARRILGLLPQLSDVERDALAQIYGATGMHTAPSVRPFRAPHHTASEPGLVGAGGARCIPGEVSLAHAGVLYLENAPEFRRAHLDAITRTIRTGTAFLPIDGHCKPFASRPLLVASADTCPCGVVRGRCDCGPDRAHVYRRRVEPLLPLLDVAVEVGVVQHGDAWEPTETIARRVADARRFRQRRGAGSIEREPASGLLLTVAPGRATALLGQGIQREALERRLHVARTIADLDGSAQIHDEHVQEAIRLTTALETLR